LAAGVKERMGWIGVFERDKGEEKVEAGYSIDSFLEY
jgi:hypothetical protein